MTNLDKVLNLVPSHELAQEFRRKAVTLPVAKAADSGGGGMPIALLGGIAALLLVGGGTTFVLMRRRSPRNLPAATRPNPPAPAYTVVSAPADGSWQAASANGDHPASAGRLAAGSPPARGSGNDGRLGDRSAGGGAGPDGTLLRRVRR